MFTTSIPSKCFNPMQNGVGLSFSFITLSYAGGSATFLTRKSFQAFAFTQSIVHTYSCRKGRTCSSALNLSIDLEDRDKFNKF